MFERFTDEGRRVVVLAHEECRRLDHQHIGTEHLLLGLLYDMPPETALALPGVSIEAARAQVELSHPRGHRSPAGHVPFTERAKRALEAAGQDESSQIGRSQLMLGLLDVRDGNGVQALVDLGVDVDAFALRVDELAMAEAAAPPEQDTGPAAAAAVARLTRGARRSRSSREVDLTEVLRQRARLSQALRRYGQHEVGCARVPCQCGFEQALEDLEPPESGWTIRSS